MHDRVAPDNVTAVSAFRRLRKGYADVFAIAAPRGAITAHLVHEQSVVMAYEAAGQVDFTGSEGHGGRTDFATRLRTARIAAGFATARQFAHALGLAENRYTRYERGETEPALGTVARICRILGITPDELLGFMRSAPAFGQRNGLGNGFGEPTAAGPLHDASPEDARQIAGGRRWLCWQLACECTPDTATSPEPETALMRLRKTCELFRQIERDPLGFIAATVESPAVDRLPPARQRSLANVIDALCAVLATPSTEQNLTGE